MIRISLEFETVESAARFLAGISEHPLGFPLVSSIAPVSEQAAESAPPKRARKPRKAKDKAEAPVAAPAATENVPSLDDIRASLNTLLAARGIDACQELLARYGIARLSLLLPNRYADFLTECQNLCELG